MFGINYFSQLTPFVAASLSNLTRLLHNTASYAGYTGCQDLTRTVGAKNVHYPWIFNNIIKYGEKFFSARVGLQGTLGEDLWDCTCLCSLKRINGQFSWKKEECLLIIIKWDKRKKGGTIQLVSAQPTVRGPEFDPQWHDILVSSTLLSVKLWLAWNTLKTEHWWGGGGG